MITIYANLKTGERHVTEESHPDDLPITVFTQYLLPDILEKLKEKERGLIAEDNSSKGR